MGCNGTVVHFPEEEILKPHIHVWSKLAKNSILVGQVEAYCLVCDCYLRTEESAAAHIDKPVHGSNLHAAGYFEKYKHDFIRKVKSGYFCGLCNALLPTAARVGLHVAEPSHRDNKGALLLRRPDGAILAHDSVLLEEDAWHGLLDDTCLVCNAEFDDKSIHKNEHAHLLKLVQNKVILGALKSVYRKIDENSYQCLTCNNVFAAASFNEHFESTDHKTAHEQCEIAVENVVSSNASDKTNTTDKSIDRKHNGDIKTSIGNEQDSESRKAPKTSIGNEQDSESRKAPKTSIGNEQDSESGKAPKTSVANEQNSKSCKTTNVNLDDVYCEALGAKNYIVDMDEGGLGKFCILCHSGLPMLEPVAKHLHSKHHQTMLKLHRENVEKKSEMMKDTEEAATTKRYTKESAETKSDTERAAKTKIGAEKAAKTKRDAEELAKTKKDTEKAARTKTKSEHDGKAQEIGSNNKDNRSLILDSVSQFQKNEVNINFINDTAFCKKCTMNVDFDFSAINKHIDDHKKTSNKKEDRKVPFEHGAEANGGKKNLYTKPVFTTRNEAPVSATPIEDIKALAKKYGMMYNGRQLHCTLCDSTVTMSERNIEEHISGSKHKAKMSQVVVKQAPKMNITKQKLENFIKDLTMVETDGSEEIVINEKYCISFLNFLFLGQTLSSELVCAACNIKLTSIGMQMHHIDDPRHRKFLEECQVITSLDSEFVREMRPGVYHCGFCNDVSDDWDTLDKHLTTPDHRRCRTGAEWRLQEYITEIRVYKVRKQMEFEMLARNMSNMFMPNMFNRRNSDSDSD